MHRNVFIYSRTVIDSALPSWFFFKLNIIERISCIHRFLKCIDTAEEILQFLSITFVNKCSSMKYPHNTPYFNLNMILFVLVVLKNVHVST